MATISESSSEHYVIPDEVLIEILLRLPLLSLQLFKSVSKYWLSLITSEYFIRRLKKPRIENPCGLFIQERKSEHYGFLTLGPKVTSFPLRATIAEAGSCFCILHSCNGLFLCRNVVSDRACYYVYNPLTNLFKNIPFARVPRVTNMILAFDPTKSPYYKLVVTKNKVNWEQDLNEDHWEEYHREEDREQDSAEQDSDEQDSDEQDSDEQYSDEQYSDEQDSEEQDSEEQDSDEQDSDEQDSDEEDNDEEDNDEEDNDEEDREQDSDEQDSDEEDSDEEDNDEEDSDTEQILIYSSETGKWRRYDPPIHKDRSWVMQDGIYWNNAIHWIYYDDDDLPLHFNLDIVDHPVISIIQTPAVDDVRNTLLYESRGILLLLMEDKDHCYHIFEMREESSEWSLKYIVNDIANNILPCGWLQVLCIVLGEREDDSFMVIESHNKIVQYNFVSKTVSTIYNFISSHSIVFGRVPFIASLASV